MKNLDQKYAEAYAYLLKNGFDKTLINSFGKKRCIAIALKHKEQKDS